LVHIGNIPQKKVGVTMGRYQTDVISFRGTIKRKRQRGKHQRVVKKKK